MAYIVILIVLIILFFVKKGRKEVYSDMGKLLLCAGLLPIIRYIVLANHACVHSYFTYRALIVTVMCIALFFTYVLNPQRTTVVIKSGEDNGRCGLWKIGGIT